jgi:hypothetical protein
MRNISDLIYREIQSTHVTFNNDFLWKKRGRAGQTTHDNILGSIRFAFWKSKATSIHLEYVLLTAFPLQQLLRESTSMLLCTYIVCLYCSTNLHLHLRSHAVCPLSKERHTLFACTMRTKWPSTITALYEVT